VTESKVRRANPVLRRIAFLGNFGHYLFPLGALALVSVPIVLVYQLLEWFEGGKWPPLSFADGLRFAGVSEPRFETAVLQQTNESLMQSPLALVLLFGIGVPLFLYARFSKWLERYCEPEKADEEIDLI